MTPLELVQAQLKAYNNRDLETFCTYFAQDVKVFEGRDRTLIMDGMASFRERYRSTFSNEKLNCQLVHRIDLGDIVIDHERVSGFHSEIVEAVAVYRVENGLLQEVTFY